MDMRGIPVYEGFLHVGASAVLIAFTYFAIISPASARSSSGRPSLS
jgi:hypothetical protein